MGNALAAAGGSGSLHGPWTSWQAQWLEPLLQNDDDQRILESHRFGSDVEADSASRALADKCVRRNWSILRQLQRIDKMPKELAGLVASYVGLVAWTQDVARDTLVGCESCFECRLFVADRRLARALVLEAWRGTGEKPPVPFGILDLLPDLPFRAKPWLLDAALDARVDGDLPGALVGRMARCISAWRA